KDELAAEQLLQEAFVAFAADIAAYQPARETLGTWSLFKARDLALAQPRRPEARPAILDGKFDRDGFDRDQGLDQKKRNPSCTESFSVAKASPRSPKTITKHPPPSEPSSRAICAL
ncbi:MAG: hypothetical protein ABIR71_02590, partial [Chthoniobacterales bacterium]